MYYQQFRTNKFKNKRTEFGGRNYHSKLEASYAADLELARKATRKEDRVIDITPQFSVNIWVDKDGKLTDNAEEGKYKICQYRPDFRVKYADGHEEIVEVKGLWLGDALMKWRLLEALYSTKYPDVILRVIK